MKFVRYSFVYFECLVKKALDVRLYLQDSLDKNERKITWGGGGSINAGHEMSFSIIER